MHWDSRVDKFDKRLQLVRRTKGEDVDHKIDTQSKVVAMCAATYADALFCEREKRDVEDREEDAQ